MANDSEATRAAGMTSEQRVKAAVPDARIIRDQTITAGISGGVWGTTGKHIAWMADSWDEAVTHPFVVAYEAQHRPVREDRGFTPASPEDRAVISDLMREVEEHNGMRDTTEAVSGEKPKCKFCPSESIGKCKNCDAPICADHDSLEFDDVTVCADNEACEAAINHVTITDHYFYTTIPDSITCAEGSCRRPESDHLKRPNPVAPDSGKDAFEAWLEGFRFRYQNGMEFTPVEKDIARHAWNGRAALESKPAPEGEVKVTWRVEYYENSSWWVICHKPSDEKSQREQFLRDVIGLYTEVRLIKTETYETVVETRKKGA